MFEPMPRKADGRSQVIVCELPYHDLRSLMRNRMKANVKQQQKQDILTETEKSLHSQSSALVFFLKLDLSSLRVPTGSPLRGGNVAVYVFDINQQSLPTRFYSILVSVCLYGPFNCISFYEFSRQLSAFSPLFFRSYFCLIGPFNFISVRKSPSALI